MSKHASWAQDSPFFFQQPCPYKVHKKLYRIHVYSNVYFSSSSTYALQILQEQESKQKFNLISQFENVLRTNIM